MGTSLGFLTPSRPEFSVEAGVRGRARWRISFNGRERIARSLAPPFPTTRRRESATSSSIHVFLLSVQAKPLCGLFYGKFQEAAGEGEILIKSMVGGRRWGSGNFKIPRPLFL